MDLGAIKEAIKTNLIVIKTNLVVVKINLAIVKTDLVAIRVDLREGRSVSGQLPCLFPMLSRNYRLAHKG